MKKFKLKKVFIIIGLLIFFLVSSTLVVQKSYKDNLRPLSNDQTKIVVTVEPGSAPGEIADTLKAKGVVKSDWAFEWYVRNHNLREKLKAGTYVLSPSQSIPEIAGQIADGKVATDLVTILPGKRLDQVRIALIESGFSEKAVDAALDPAQYAGHPALTDKPKTANLEGYLYPESFQKTAETTPEQIIRLSLDEMAARLTPDARSALATKGLSLHEAVTLASIIEQEVSDPSDRAQVAQVFLKRLKSDRRLESNATDVYAEKNPDYDSYKIAGLPPGPVGNVSGESLEALTYPAETDWLYFVSGDDGKTHFSKTLEEHQELTRKYCHENCR